jgi:hypothetical protein
LTDFLAASFHRSVVVELGLDRFPKLRNDYFGNYRRMVWLSQRPTPTLEVAAAEAAASVGLPLDVVNVGLGGLERELARLLELGQSTRLSSTQFGSMNSARLNTGQSQ